MIESTEIINEDILGRYKRILNTFDSTFMFHKSVIVEEVVKEIKPTSVYLIGSFGRDEGSFRVSGETINPVRDYDILIVVDKGVKSDVIKRIRKNIHKRLRLPDPYSKEFKFRGFSVWITQETLKNINELPMLKFYELKKASKLLWGKDVRESISISFEDLSLYNGILILFGKIEGLLGFLNIDALRRERSQEQAVDFVYECMKTYIEIGTCLSLLAKMYEPSFLGRCYRLSRNFETLFPELKQMSDTLPSSMLIYAYKRLLIEDGYLNSLDLAKLLIQTLKDLRIAIWYYVHKAYEVNMAYSPTSPAVIDDYVKKLDKRVLQDLFDYHLKVKLGFHSKIFRELAIRFYLRYTLLMFFAKARKKGYRIKPGVIFMRNGNIMMKLWSLGFMLLNSVKHDFKIDERVFYTTTCKLQQIVIKRCLSKEKPKLRFSYLRRITLDLLDLADKVFHRKLEY